MSKPLILFIFHLCFSLLIGYATGQVSNQVAALVDTKVRLTFNIPSNVNDLVTIKLQRSDGSGSHFIYVTKNFEVKVVDIYTIRINVTSKMTERRIDVVIPSVQVNDAGLFQCFPSTLSTAIANCGQKLIIVLKPNAPTITPLTSALEGETLKLSCVTNSTTLPADHGLTSHILWRNDQGQIVGVPSTDKLNMDADGVLQVKNIGREDDGKKFTCTSSNKADGIPVTPESNNSLPYVITVKYKPNVNDFIITPPVIGDAKIIKSVSDDLTYTCDITCEPACTVQWSFASYANTSAVQVTDSKFLKKTVQRSDQGTYSCIGTNKHGSAKKYFFLEVHYISPPVISINSKTEDNVNVTEWQPVNLECMVDALPAPQIIWKSNVILSHEEGFNLAQNIYSSSYLVHSVKCEDGGVYSCEGKNVAGSEEKRVNMIVLCPPSRVDAADLTLQQEYSWEINKSLSFSFVIKGYPEPSVTKVTSTVNNVIYIEDMSQDIVIKKDAKYNRKDYLTKFTFTSRRLLDISDENRIFTLKFDATEAGLTNNIEFVIRIKGPPQPVDNITSVDIKHASVKLFWMTGFNGGEQQYFNVEYRPYSSDPSLRWNVAVKDIKDAHLPMLWTEAIITNLQSDTHYEFRIVSINKLGSAESQPFRVKTSNKYDLSLSVGSIVSISLGVVFSIIFSSALAYAFVFRRKSETCKSKL